MRESDPIVLKCCINKDEFYRMMLAIHHHTGEFSRWRWSWTQIAMLYFFLTLFVFLASNSHQLNALEVYRPLAINFLLSGIVFSAIMMRLKHQFNRHVYDSTNKESTERIIGSRTYILKERSLIVTTAVAEIDYALNGVSDICIIGHNIIYVEHAWFSIPIPPMAFPSSSELSAFAETLRNRVIAAGGEVIYTDAFKVAE